MSFIPDQEENSLTFALHSVSVQVSGNRTYVCIRATNVCKIGSHDTFQPNVAEYDTMLISRK